MEKRLFRGIRTITTRESVEVFADSMHEAREMFEEDDPEVRVTFETDSDYEIYDIDEVKI